MNAPRLAFHCGTCDSEMESVCRECERRHHDEQCEQHARDTRDEREAHDHCRAAAGPLLTDLELIVGAIKLDCSTTEDGDPYYEATATLFGELVTGTSGGGFEGAVRALRLELVREMRGWADYVENEVGS